MGILGKDLFDIGRPITHTKVQFGRDAYWIEDNPVPYPYGSMLTRLLDYDAAPYLALVSTLQDFIKTGDRKETLSSFCEVVNAFIRLPFYRSYIQDHAALEPMFLLPYFETGDDVSLTDIILKDDGRILNKYLWAAEDIQMIQTRYAWFLDTMFAGQPPEKKKGQRKKPLAEQILKQNLDAYVSGRTLGQDPHIDAPQVNVQFAILEVPGGEPELVEKMYFDRLSDFVYVELMKGLQKGFTPKRCQNCGRWFLQTPGATYAYCNRPIENESDMTCRDIGAKISFSDKVKNNEIWQIHQRAYKKYFARTRKGTMTRAEFEQWAREAELLRDEALEEYRKALSQAQRNEIVDTLKKKLNSM